MNKNAVTNSSNRRKGLAVFIVLDIVADFTINPAKSQAKCLMIKSFKAFS